MDTLLEVERRGQEEVERLEDAIVKEMMKPTKTVSYCFVEVIVHILLIGWIG
jgi:hypothetical protein